MKKIVECIYEPLHDKYPTYEFCDNYPDCKGCPYNASELNHSEKKINNYILIRGLIIYRSSELFIFRRGGIGRHSRLKICGSNS